MLAAYRFFDQANNAKRPLKWETVLAPHIERTAARMRQHRVVPCLQDTTELDFNGRSIEGLGPLSYEAQRGMYLHPTYAVTPEREPLGITDAWMWARTPKADDGTRAGVRENVMRCVARYRRWLCWIHWGNVYLCSCIAPLRFAVSFIAIDSICKFL